MVKNENPPHKNQPDTPLILHEEEMSTVFRIMWQLTNPVKHFLIEF